MPSVLAPVRSCPRPPRGFTLIEMLTATALTLLLMGAVVTMFGRIGSSVNESRAGLEMSDRLRLAATTLQRDLAGVTVTMLPPRNPEDAEGYFEIVEGPVGTPAMPPSVVAINSDTGQDDTSVIDFDDILMFTTRSTTRPFIGRCLGRTIESDVAEVAWFVRGRTLYRRVLLVGPGAVISSRTVPPADPPGTTTVATDIRGFYANNDISVRYDATAQRLVANTLGDLSRRECRFAHPGNDPNTFPQNGYPFDVRRWGQLGLPTLRECSSPTWNLTSPQIPPALRADKTSTLDWNTLIQNQNKRPDFWSNRPDKLVADNYLIANVADGTRIAEDVILTHVIGFDVKVYDPGVPPGQGDRGGNAAGEYGGYVDLGYGNQLYGNYINTVKNLPRGTPLMLFPHLGVPGYHPPAQELGLDATAQSARVYDTGSSHYEAAGRWWDPDPRKSDVAGQGVNGFDDDGDGVVDGPSEMIARPPYPAPLRGIQVKIRCFEPSSRQVREVTVVQDFLPK